MKEATSTCNTFLTVQLALTNIRHLCWKTFYIYLLTYFLNYLINYSIEQSPSWEANRFSASQEIRRIYGTRRFITVVTSTRQFSLSWASSIQSVPPHPTYKFHVTFSLLKLQQNISPGPRRTIWLFRNMKRFYREELLALRPTPGWRSIPCRLSATTYSLYSQLPSILEATKVTNLKFICPSVANIIPNYNQKDARFRDLFISTDALQVSGGSSAHHREHKTVHTASGIVNQYCC